MPNDLKALFGSWEQALGTLLSAISSTPKAQLNERIRTGLSLIGNAMQATGNALMADSERTITLNKIGNQIQAIGNSTVILGLIIQANTRTKTELNIKGNLLQALGSGISFAEIIQNKKRQPLSSEELLNLYGSLLQMIGNSLQAISGRIKLQGQNGQTLNFVGSWIQAVGAFLQALAQRHDQNR